MKLILASQSTNRKRLFEQVGLEFEVVVSHFDEDMTQDLSPEELVQDLALGKAQTVAEQHPDAVVVGADSIFVLDGKVGGKPEDEEAAFVMLTKLKSQPHDFVSGYAIVNAASGRRISGYSKVRLYLRSDLTDQDIRNYIKREREPVTTKAGSYDDANMGVGLIEKIEGDYTAGLGMPIGLVLRDLKDFGINPLG